MTSIVVIDNSKTELSPSRLDGFVGAVKTYRQSHPDSKLKLYIIHYTQIEKYQKVIAKADGFILSGSKLKLSNFYTTDKIMTFRPEMDIILNTEKPVLGICFGHELIAVAYGFHIINAVKPEQGFMELEFSEPFPLLPARKNVFVEMQHIKQIEHSERFDLFFTNYLSSNGTTVAAFKHQFKRQFGVQFHPETLDYHAMKDGRAILHGFFDLCVDGSV